MIWLVGHGNNMQKENIRFGERGKLALIKFKKKGISIKQSSSDAGQSLSHSPRKGIDGTALLADFFLVLPIELEISPSAIRAAADLGFVEIPPALLPFAANK
jgi:hypothetical protein